MDPPGPVCGADPLIETQTWQDAFSEVQAMLQKACHAPTDLPLSYHVSHPSTGATLPLGSRCHAYIFSGIINYSGDVSVQRNTKHLW